MSLQRQLPVRCGGHRCDSRCRNGSESQDTAASAARRVPTRKLYLPLASRPVNDLGVALRCTLEKLADKDVFLVACVHADRALDMAWPQKAYPNGGKARCVLTVEFEESVGYVQPECRDCPRAGLLSPGISDGDPAGRDWQAVAAGVWNYQRGDLLVKPEDLLRLVFAPGHPLWSISVQFRIE